MKSIAVKFAEGSDNIIEGLAIPFGKDTDGEDFGPDTDLALDWFPDEGRPFLYHHGLDESVKTTVVGRQIERWTDDLGHWVKIQLDKRSRYMDAIKQLVDAGALGLSSGAMPHLVNTTKSGHIDRWPWVEISGTPSPSHPGATLYGVKTSDAIEHLTAIKAELPEPLKAIMDESLDASLAGMSYAEQGDRLLDSVSAFVTRSRDLALLRMKGSQPRLTATNRDRLFKHLALVEVLQKEIRGLLDETDPDASSKTAQVEFLRFQHELARQHGMPVEPA